MTGRRTSIDSITRRGFLQRLSGLLPAVVLADLFLSGCAGNTNPVDHIKGGIVGANNKVGHRLRNPGDIPEPGEVIKTDVLIAGGGIAGLSARRWLANAGVTDMIMVEMDGKPGGNSVYGENEVSRYPWAAHYLPVPDPANKELLHFLAQAGVIVGWDDGGLPVYNELHICQDPEERLYLNGQWQEGIIPAVGVKNSGKKEMERFFLLMEHYKQAVGNDGLDAFAIPVDRSSADMEYRSLDNISFREFLDREQFRDPHLRWYLEYCSKDDYGSNLENTSAWAGVHYFASRKGRGHGVNSSTVLTWPEGNGFLMNALKAQANTSVRTNSLVYRIALDGDHVLADCFEPDANRSVRIKANKAILCTPQFVTRHILPAASRGFNPDAFQYAPWMIANLTLQQAPFTNSLPLCWDNVIYGTDSVGYVNANHQNLQNSLKKVLTYYLPLTGEDPSKARTQAQTRSYHDWLASISRELEMVHPGITKSIERADIWVWGHGMIMPRPGFIWGRDRALASKHVDNKIFFAHSDQSGISIFEEAFYQGIRAARELLEA